MAAALGSGHTPSVVARNRLGDRFEPDDRRAGLMITECQTFITESHSNRASLDAGEAALKKRDYSSSLQHFDSSGNNRWTRELVHLCATAPYLAGDLEGTNSAFKKLGMQPHGWLYQARDLLKRSYRGFGATEPTPGALAERVQAALSAAPSRACGASPSDRCPQSSPHAGRRASRSPAASRARCHRPSGSS